jgi:hypothetical protein
MRACIHVCLGGKCSNLQCRSYTHMCHACMHIFVHTIRFLQETMDLSEDTELTYDQVRVRVCVCVCERERERERE